MDGVIILIFAVGWLVGLICLISIASQLAGLRRDERERHEELLEMLRWVGGEGRMADDEDEKEEEKQGGRPKPFE